MRESASRAIAAAIVVLGSAGLAQASPLLLNETLEATYLFPDSATVYASSTTTALVGPGIEFVGFAGFADIDVSDTNILITTTRNAGINNVTFDGFRFVDVLGTIAAFTNVLLNPSSTYAGLDSSRLTFTADAIFVNVAGLPGLQGQTISIDVNPEATAPVPEPGSITLLGIGLIGAGTRRWRRSLVARRGNLQRSNILNVEENIHGRQKGDV